ncbi:hypothetical protein QW180_31595 [Vibrio sinaloensis]|nr:hypothetical protein [Vibrio sinaloensis]
MKNITDIYKYQSVLVSPKKSQCLYVVSWPTQSNLIACVFFFNLNRNHAHDQSKSQGEKALPLIKLKKLLLSAIQRALGHSKPGMTIEYIDVSQKSVVRCGKVSLIDIVTQSSKWCFYVLYYFAIVYLKRDGF